MKRRAFITLLGAAAAWPSTAQAQRIDRTLRRLGVLMPFTPDDPEGHLRVPALEQGLRDLGWHNGRNIRIEYRWAADDPDLLRSAATALVGSVPDVILADSTPVLSALRKESTTLPMVFMQVTDPVGSGFVPNLARPGGNVTGFTNFEFTISGKWLQTLKEVAPAVTRVAVVFNPPEHDEGCSGDNYKVEKPVKEHVAPPISAFFRAQICGGEPPIVLRNL
jgi:ABC transporter substrate binding protein